MAGRFVPLLLSAGLVPCLFATGCTKDDSPPASRDAVVRITVLADSLAVLRKQFNQDRDKLRAIALFSPT